MRRWTEISSNPDAEAVTRWRQQRVLGTAQDSCDDLLGFITSELSGADVLDYGYANHSNDTADMADDSTHSLVVSVAKSVLGVDVVEGESESGAAVRYLTADLLAEGATVPNDLVGAFDVFFASAVLELLDRPGSLFSPFRRGAPYATYRRRLPLIIAVFLTPLSRPAVRWYEARQGGR